MKKLDKPVLAEGEVTGHAHVLDADVDVIELDNGNREFSTGIPVTIKHEEHKPVALPGGAMESGRVMEYDHFAEEAKRVQD
jgi:hypothetical protein